MQIGTDEERQKLINKAIGIQNLAQLEETRSALQEWLRAYPDDAAMREIDEQLA